MAFLWRSLFDAIFPNAREEASLLSVIQAVKAGAITKGHLADYSKIAGNLTAAGADAFLIACTEFSVLGTPAGAVRPSIDTMNVLVDATIAQARRQVLPLKFVEAG